jgi:hypothetical protein
LIALVIASRTRAARRTSSPQGLQRTRNGTGRKKKKEKTLNTSDPLCLVGSTRRSTNQRTDQRGARPSINKARFTSKRRDQPSTQGPTNAIAVLLPPGRESRAIRSSAAGNPRTKEWWSAHLLLLVGLSGQPIGDAGPVAVPGYPYSGVGVGIQRERSRPTGTVVPGDAPQQPLDQPLDHRGTDRSDTR